MTVLTEPPTRHLTIVPPAAGAPSRPGLVRQCTAPVDAATPLIRRGNTAQVPVTTEELLLELHGLPAGHPGRAALRRRLIEQNLPLARRLARRYAGRGEPLDDLTQVACLALIKAIDGYEPARQIPFVGYATPSILGTLKRHFRDTTWMMRVTRSTQELSRAIGTATSELSQHLGRRPTRIEVAAHLHVSVEKLQAATGAAQAYHPVSLDALRAGADGPGIGDHLGDTDPGYEHVDEALSHQPLLARLASLPLGERRILTLRFYDQMSQTSIAAEVGLSQMHVSRLLKQSLAHLRADLPVHGTISPIRAETL